MAKNVSSSLKKRTPERVIGIIPVGERVVQQVRIGTSRGLRFEDRNGKRHYCWDSGNAARFLDWVDSYDETRREDRIPVSEILRRTGLSAREMAALLGMSPEKVGDWLRGTVAPSKIAYKKMVEVLDGRPSDETERCSVGVRSDVVGGIRPAVSEAEEALHRSPEAERREPAGVS